MEPDPVEAGEDIDQDQKARNREGRYNRRRLVRQPVQDGAQPRGRLMSVANPGSANFGGCRRIGRGSGIRQPKCSYSQGKLNGR